MDSQQPLTIRRIFLSATAIGVAWQVYVIGIAFRYGASLRSLLHGLGAEPSVLTRAFLVGYPWLVLVPILSFLLAWDVARRREIPAAYGTTVLLVCLGSGFVIEACVTEAFFEPLFSLIRQVG